MTKLNKKDSTSQTINLVMDMITNNHTWLSHTIEVYPDGKRIIKITERPIKGENE